MRQTTSGAVAYGDVLVVQLATARNLIAADWNGLSDPYCLFALGSQTARSSIQPETLNPNWNECFAFWIDPAKFEDPKLVLSVMCFDHDTFTPDDPLGTFEICVKDIERDQTVALPLASQSGCNTVL